ncbi:hypothetical protein N9948_01070 [bacterium]|nr:hypothetical protein [bacterium]
MEKWGRNLYVLKYPDGKFASINTNKNVLKKVDLKQAYLFTKNKVDKYLTDELEEIEIEVFIKLKE